MSSIVSIPVASYRRCLTGVWLACLLLTSPRFTFAQELTFLTLNGPQSRVGSADGQADTARFNTPAGLAIDSAGNLYVADQTNHTIRKITVDGFVSTLAGKAGKPGTNDGTGITARFNRPSAVAVDASGNVYVADTGNHVIRQVTAAGIVTTLAGSPGSTGWSNGTGSDARFNSPTGIAANTNGALFVADTGNHTIRKVVQSDAAWTVKTVAGQAGSAGFADGTNTAARFSSPAGLAFDQGRLYIADSGNGWIRVFEKGLVSSLARWGSSPRPLAVAAKGTNILVTDSFDHTMWRVAVVVTSYVYSVVMTNFPSNSLTPVVVTNSYTNISTHYFPTNPAGSLGIPGDIDGMGIGARFNTPVGIAIDDLGNAFVADTLNHSIRKLVPSGTNWMVTTFAGPWEIPGNVDGPGMAAQFNHPLGVALDAKGNVWISDSDNQTIRKLKTDGTVKTVAGQALLAGYVDATNGSARFNRPAGLVALNSGGLLIADQQNHTIRHMASGGIVTNYAGRAQSPGSGDGPRDQAQFNQPADVAVDNAGTVYVADMGNNKIRIILTNEVLTLAGSLESGTNDGAGTAARFSLPKGIAVDSATNIYVADWGNHTIRKIAQVNVNGTNLLMVTTFAGRPGVAGWTDGLGRNALFYNPSGVAVDAAGVVYVADTGNHVIRKITPGGLVSSVAGKPGNPGNQDGVFDEARFRSPSGIEVDSAGRLFVTDTGNHTLRLVQPDGTVSTLAGPAGVRGTEDDLHMNNPGGLATDVLGNLYIADWGTHTIRWISPGGAVGTLAGIPGIRGESEGPGYRATFDHPFAVAVDRAINVYVADTVNHTIRRIARDGTVTTLAGRANNAGSSDGTGGDARFNFPVGIAVDSVTNLYVADYNNHTIRRSTSAGLVTTFAGQAGKAGSSDGTGSTARFNHPRSVATDATGNVYVADGDNHTVRKITPAGVVTTLAGLAGTPGTNDGLGNLARFGSPQAVAVDAAGRIYVTDTNHTVRLITPDGNVKTVAGSAGQPGYADGTGPQVRLNHPGGLTTTPDGHVYLSDSGNNVIRVGYVAPSDQPVIDLTPAPAGQMRQLSIANQTAVAWSWSFVRRPGGSSAQLSSTTAASPTFTPDVADVYVFRLSATNAAGHVAMRDVTLRATAAAAPAGQMWTSTGSSSGWVAINLTSIHISSPPRLQPQRAPLGQGILLTLVSDAIQPCELQAADSPSSTQWTTLATLTNIAGANTFYDSTTNLPARFYRLRQLP